MTREATDLSSDVDELYAALWQSVTFPRLPPDAPKELKKFTIEIDDPRRVYAIHQASRRHQVQILVERYIIQLRYGCQNPNCLTTTCFSCRKRLADGAPVRRYNSTSARTLAIYLASQDNPEQGLCHHPSNNPPARLSKSQSKSSSPPSEQVPNGKPDISRKPSRSKTKIKAPDFDATERTASRRNSPGPKTEILGVPASTRSQKGRLPRETKIISEIVEEDIKQDHKSFVQNVFGTKAFKMMEWLTPQSLTSLATVASEQLGAQNRRDVSTTAISDQSSKEETLGTETGRKEPRISDDAKAPEKENISTTSKLLSSITSSSQLPEFSNESGSRANLRLDTAKVSSPIDIEIPPVANGHTPNYEAEISPQLIGGPKLPQNKGRRGSRAGISDSKLTKGILNTPTSPRTQASPSEILPSGRDTKSAKPKRQLSRHAAITSLNLDDLEIESAQKPIRPKSITSLSETQSKEVKGPSSVLVNSRSTTKLEEKDDKEKQEEPSSEIASSLIPTKDLLMPQSLSQLSCETIDLVCDILQEDRTAEKHSLSPAETARAPRKETEHLSRKKFDSSVSSLNSSYPSYCRQQWSDFIKQSLFDVLSRPDALIKTFSDSEGTLYDTHTIWYLMVRLTRVAPSLVFNSLWIAAGSMFATPVELEREISESETKNVHNDEIRTISHMDAARLMNICLQALVAAAPLVSSARQLANMSRIRSYGLLSMVGRDSSNLEPLSLCLKYEDAFTHELALRLARRIFAAVSIQKRFAQLAEVNTDVLVENNTAAPAFDIFQSLFSSLKFTEITPSIPDFSSAERDVHEKRLPTLILDWARTVMMQDWKGTAEVPRDGSFGGALFMIAAIYEKRKSLLLGDIHFYSSYFNERLDTMQMPIQWLSFESNEKTLHLLDFPYLFNPATLVTYFRSINYARMSQSFEAARSEQAFASHTAADKQLITDPTRRSRLYERLRVATSKYNVLHISRDNVLVDAFNQVWRREERELMRPLKIRLGEEGGEEGSDSGGVQQEFFRLAIAEALNPDYGTFTIDQRTKMTWFQPGSPEPLWKFELIGLLVSLAVYNGLTLPVTFPKALYRRLLGEKNSELHHIEDGWPDLTNGLTTLLEWDEADGSVEDIFTRTYEFSVDQFGQPVSRDMAKDSHWPQFSDLMNSISTTDAPMVTGENRSEYVSDYIHWLTDVSIQPQFDAFKRGFFTCITHRSISLFTPEILQSVVEGVQEIDIPDLRRYTRYVGWDASHRTVKDFWSIVKRYNFEQKRKLLEFVTASDRVPVGGMRNLQFVIQRNGVGDGHLPTSYTCYGTLLLPEYSSKEVLREKIGMALENSKGFGFA